ncbi:MAG: hypothetical protein ABSG77_09790 [Candidatus Acidiferrum sp.]|jgi:hypothetical protein
MQTALIVVLSLLNVGVVGLGIYLASYLKKKAQNLATREEFKDLQKQTAELTRTTKEIEATISGELWNQQKRWELKREVFFQVMKRISAVFDALKDLDNVLQTELRNPSVVTETWKEISVSENAKWFRAMAALHESQLFVGVTCGKDVVGVLDKYVILTTGVSGRIHKKDGQIFKSSADQLFDLHEAMRAAFRKELGITH